MKKLKILFSDLVPGETPIDDSSGLLVRGITTRQELSGVEGENIRKVLVRYFTDPSGLDAVSLGRADAPFDFEWVVRLHREMFGDVWSWAGRFRTEDINIGVHFPQIGERLYNLIEDLGVWKTYGMGVIEQAARLHHVAVQIHPFPNGNGRWGRLLTNIWLALHESPIVAWPEELIGEASSVRDEYLATLRLADGGELDPFVALHARYLADSR